MFLFQFEGSSWAIVKMWASSHWNCRAVCLFSHHNLELEWPNEILVLPQVTERVVTFSEARGSLYASGVSVSVCCTFVSSHSIKLKVVFASILKSQVRYCLVNIKHAVYYNFLFIEKNYYWWAYITFHAHFVCFFIISDTYLLEWCYTLLS